MEHKIEIVEAGENAAEKMKEAFGDEAPTLTITIDGKSESGRSTVAGIMKNSIKKNLLDSGRLKEPARILIVVEGA